MGIRHLTELPSSAELVIVGGGVMGAATALAARRAGLDPLVLEARPAPASATTAVATGAFRLQHDDPDELELARESVAAFRDFAAFTGQDRYGSGLVVNGRIHATCTEQGAVAQRELVARQAALGVTEVELLDGDAARARFGFLGQAVRQVRYRAGDGLLDPKQASLGLLEGAGAAVATRCRVTGFELAGGRLVAVQTERGRIAADTCVIAAGPLSGVVARLAGVELPLRVLRRHKVVLPDVPQVPADAPLVYDDDTGAHWRAAFRGAVVLAPDADDVEHDPAFDPAPDTAFPYAVLDPGEPDVRRPRDAVLARGLAGRPGGVDAAVRPVHDDARPPAAARRDAGCGPLRQHRLQRPRRDAERRRRAGGAGRDHGWRRRPVPARPRLRADRHPAALSAPAARTGWVHVA